MPPVLPIEVIDLVVGHVAEALPFQHPQALLSCSLVNRSFLPLCQKHIFKAVQLHMLYSQSCDGETTAKHLEDDRRALLFIQAVIQNPALGQYVQRLNYQTSTHPLSTDPDLDIFIQALDLMPNIDDLRLAIGHPLRQLDAVVAPAGSRT
ncbi:hypothetical protein NMY22_g1808 [Coprinellus aureogranulatus]|nr:hypothetical protein NMY22_g1808 [Coprinellus aureogranulatus]